MEIRYEKTFFKSLKKMILHNKWYYKIWSFIRYDAKRFIKNIWIFRKELYHYYKWDYRGHITLLRRSLEYSVKYFEKYGLEIEETRMKKVEKMKRAIEILKWHEDDCFVELAEKRLGFELITHPWEFEKIEGTNFYKMVDNETEEEKKNNKEIFELGRKIEYESWSELFEILEGQNFYPIPKDYVYEKDFDGSGLKNWWD